MMGYRITAGLMHAGGRMEVLHPMGFSARIVREIGDIALFSRGFGGKCCGAFT
jgi:hypothetical protein